jgi:SAM-dependent methyltransferase
MVKTEAFESHALEYDRWFERHKIEYAQELKAIRSLLPKEMDGIEIGAGTGRFAGPLGISLGIEPSEAMRGIASDRGVNVIAAIAESLPFAEGLFNYALLVTTVCFLDSPESAFLEVHRILKENGFIIVGIIDRNSNLGKKYEKNESKSKFYIDAKFFSVEEIKSKLKRTGFTNFEYVQAILPGDIDESSESMVKPGYGEGSFVVLRAQKDTGT